MDKKYSILEKNHRRLLGVTTALTEALEYTVRGDEFDLEDTLNHCMAIYPQLFTHKQKKPSHRQPKKIYNTSVSEDVTDDVETENIQVSNNNNYDIQGSNKRPVVHSPVNQTQRHKLTADDRETLTIDTDGYPNIDSTKSAIFIGPDNENTGKMLSSFSPAIIQTIRVSGTPEIYVDPKETSENSHNSPKAQDFGNDGRTMKNNISDVSPYLIFSPESRRQSLSSQISDNEYLSPKNNDFVKSYGSGNRAIHELKHEEESDRHQRHVNNYEPVKRNKRPKSYASENTAWLTAERMQSQVNESEYVNANNNLIYNQNVPYEITLQQRNQSKSSVNADKNNLMIKIVPEINSPKKPLTPREEIQKVSTANKHKISNSVQTQTIISTPSETCIIITNQIDPGIVFLSNDYSIHENQDQKQEIVSENENTKSAKAGIYSDNQTTENSTDKRLEKLKKLSTGLKVQSDVMLAMDSDSCCDNQHNIHQLDTIKEVRREYSDLGQQPQNQNTCDVFSLPTHETTEKQNLAKLKDDLTKGSVKERCTILQLLRSKLIHTLAKERSSLMNLYIENDILSINQSPTMLEILMPKEIVNGWDLILQEMILKFLNTMCSMWKGRDYLTYNLNTINCLQGYFFDKYSTTSNNTAGDTTSKEMLIAIYHKLSTRQNQQSLLLNSGVAEKVAYNILETNESMTPYRLRHSIGLLINLCVSNQGRILLEPMAPDFLKMLVKLLNSKDKKILPYVARILYVLMASEVFHRTANEVHLGETLTEAIKVSKKRIKLQLEVLKTVIEQPNHHQNLNNVEENFLQNIEAELDELEEEVETTEHRLPTPKPGYFEHSTESFRCLDNKMFENNFDNIVINQKPDDASILSPTKNQVSPVKAIKKTVKTVNRGNENTTIDLKKRVLKTQKSITGNDDKIIPKNKVIDRNVKQKTVIKRNKIRKTNSKIKHEIEESLNNTPRMDESNITKEDNSKKSSNNNRLSPNMIKKQGTNMSNIEKKTSKDVKEDALKMDDKTSFLIVNDKQIKANGILHESCPTSVLKVIEYPDQTASLKLIESEKAIADKLPPTVLHHQSSVTKSRPVSQAKDSINKNGGKRSLFSPDGRLSANDYEYCEDTKQIQTPIQQNNIFRDNRQSPYRSRLNDSHTEGAERNVMRSGYVSPHITDKKFELINSSSETEVNGKKQD